MSTTEVPVFRDMVHLRSHTDACNHVVRAGRGGFPKGKSGCCCLEEEEGEMGGGVWQAPTAVLCSAPPPPPHTCSLCWCLGEGVLPVSFQPQPGWHQEGEVDIFEHSSHRPAFPRKPPHHNRRLCLHRNFHSDLHGDPTEVRTFGFLSACFKS